MEDQNIKDQMHKNFDSFFNTIDQLLFVLDKDAIILHVNTAVTKRLGYTEQELLGKSVLLVHPADRREEAGRIVQEMIDGKADFCPVPLCTKSGALIPVETRITTGEWDGKFALFGVSKDISELQLSEEKFSKAFDINTSACGISDLETGNYLEVNNAFCELLGFSKDEVIGKNAVSLGIFSEKALSDLKSKMPSTGLVKNLEADLISKNGEVKHVLLSADNIYVQNKQYRFTVAQDVTEYKKAMESLQKTNEMMVGRELKMVELKDQLEKYESSSGDK